MEKITFGIDMVRKHRTGDHKIQTRLGERVNFICLPRRG